MTNQNMETNALAKALSPASGEDGLCSTRPGSVGEKAQGKQPGKATSKMVEKRINLMLRRQERRRRQVADAARRSRKKRKEEVDRLKQRVVELEGLISEAQRKKGQFKKTKLSGMNAEEILSQNRILKDHVREWKELLGELETKYDELASPHSHHSLVNSRQWLPHQPSPGGGYSLQYLRAVRAMALETIGSYRDIFSAIDDNNLGPVLHSYSGWRAVTISFPKNVVLQYTKRIPNITVRELADGIMSFYTTPDLCWRKRYDTLTVDAQMCQYLSQEDAIMRDVFCIDKNDGELEAVHLYSRAHVKEDLCVWAAPRVNSELDIAPQRKTVDLLRGMTMERYEDGNECGVEWRIFLDSRVTTPGVARFSPTTLVNVILDELPRIESAVMDQVWMKKRAELMPVQPSGTDACGFASPQREQASF